MRHGYDPVWDMPGRSYHDYFLVSFDTMNKNTLINHTKDRTDMGLSAHSGEIHIRQRWTPLMRVVSSGMVLRKLFFDKDGYWVTA